MTELIIALDLPTATEARGLFNTLLRETPARWFKVGAAVLMTSGAAELCERIAGPASLFLDLKLYDTRDTVARIAERAFTLGTRMLTVHASPSMLAAAMGAKIFPGQRVIAVGPLTDGSGTPITGWNFDGLVCSTAFAAQIRDYDRIDLRTKIKICPGIRPVDNTGDYVGKDNHLSIASPHEAKEAGADFIVVGRPIYNAHDPAAAARAILEELG